MTVADVFWAFVMHAGTKVGTSLDDEEVDGDNGDHNTDDDDGNDDVTDDGNDEDGTSEIRTGESYFETLLQELKDHVITHTKKSVCRIDNNHGSRGGRSDNRADVRDGIGSKISGTSVQNATTTPSITDTEPASTQ